VVVEIAPGRKFSLIDLASLRVLLCDLVGREADVVVEEDLRPRFREEIARERVEVF
jgi:predicted nucleotidyltransferase